MYSRQNNGQSEKLENLMKEKNDALEEIELYEECIQKAKIAVLAIPTDLKYISHNNFFFERELSLLSRAPCSQ